LHQPIVEASSSPTSDPERILDLDLVRCTEHAALAAWDYFGRGDKNQVDRAASDAIRTMFERIDCRGVVRIGEGRKDNAPGIFTDERLGSWSYGSAPAAVALDPIDGTTLAAKGLRGAISVIALNIASRSTDDPNLLFPAIPSHYMAKLSVGPAIAESGIELDLDAPLALTIEQVARELDKSVDEVTVMLLDRPRHNNMIETLRQLGCRVRLISDGDVAAAIAPSLPNSGVDIYVGIGGSPEAVISAAAIKCLGGQQVCRIWPKDEAEREHLSKSEGCTPEDFERLWNVDTLATGDHLIVAATGVSDSTLLQGVELDGGYLKTHSLLLRAKHRTVRFVEAYHDYRRKLPRHKGLGQRRPRAAAEVEAMAI
jgi:fructose-1,6-bisphosphatase II